MERLWCLTNKHLLVMLPVLCLALALLFLPSPSAANISGDYTFTVLDEAAKTARLNRIDNAGGAVDIPAVIDGYTIIEIENTIYGSIFVKTEHMASSVTSVTVPDSVTSIGNNAFYFCASLNSVDLGSGIKSIGQHAFLSCYSLETITIPDSVTGIGGGAFEDCYGLTDVSLGSSVNIIGGGAFYSCSLKSITIPDSVEIIDDVAFSFCPELNSVDLGNGIKTIGYGAFSDCCSLNSINIPDSVTIIKDSAFNNCTNLGSAYFYGNAPTTFGSYVFDYTGPDFTIYYIAGRTGWTNPWNGYPAAAFVPQGTVPVITATEPADGGYGVNIAVNIIITFSEDVAAGGAYDNISIKDAGDNSVSVVKSVYDNTLALDPASSLLYNMVYTVDIPAGSVNNMAGIPLAQDGTFSFTTMTFKDAEDAVKDYIQSLPGSDFDGPSDERKNALNNSFNAADKMIKAGNYRGAIKILQNDIRAKADGTVDGKPNNDWIAEPAAQQNICEMIDNMIIYLQAGSGNSSR